MFHSFLYVYHRVTFPVAHPIFVASKYPESGAQHTVPYCPSVI
jgi:hypothetical protein